MPPKRTLKRPAAATAIDAVVKKEPVGPVVKKEPGATSTSTQSVSGLGYVTKEEPPDSEPGDKELNFLMSSISGTHIEGMS